MTSPRKPGCVAPPRKEAATRTAVNREKSIRAEDAWRALWADGLAMPIATARNGCGGAATTRPPTTISERSAFGSLEFRRRGNLSMIQEASPRDGNHHRAAPRAFGEHLSARCSPSHRRYPHSHHRGQEHDRRVQTPIRTSTILKPSPLLTEYRTLNVCEDRSVSFGHNEKRRNEYNEQLLNHFVPERQYLLSTISGNMRGKVEQARRVDMARPATLPWHFGNIFNKVLRKFYEKPD